ncbi:MAG TPA: hypothetical protein VFO60_12315 [Candidatus Dormibacteraeota bacterium]|nr:hypothetical protein [Candidatus Dormibacteraeota bacterium]
MLDDLSPEVLAEALPDRQIHVYPTIVSTEADAMAKARAGAPAGTLVVAAHQLSARHRPNRPWRPSADTSLSFSMVARPVMPPLRAGVLYLAATAALAEALGERQETSIEWPDEVMIGDDVAAYVGIHRETSVKGLEWALVNAMIRAADPPRADLLARAVAALEDRLALPPDELLADWLPRCRTIGRVVEATLYPIGAGRKTGGQAKGVRPTGYLVLETASGKDAGVSPFDIAGIEFPFTA